MKKFLAVAAMMAVGSVHAEELKFGDLNYFLKQGQFNVAADAKVNNEEERIDGNDNLQVDGFYINSKFSYALANNLNIFLGLDYLFDVETDVNDKTYNTSGLQNPIFGANFRVMNQNDGAFNLDLGAFAQVKVLDREVGSTDPSKKGNTLDPLYSNHSDIRNTLGVNARVGKKWNEANEVYFLVGADYHLAGDYDKKGTSTENVDLKNSLDLKAAAFYQYRPVHEFMMTLGLTGTRFGDLDGEDSNNDVTYTNHIDASFLFDAKYLITENFIAKFAFTKDRRGEFTFEEEGSSDADVDKREATTYGLGVDFLF